MKKASEAAREDNGDVRGDRESVPIDLSILAQISGGDRSIETRMLSAFRKSNEADTAALSDAINMRNILAVARISHRLTGAARVAGAMALSCICDAMEQAALSGDWDGVAVNAASCYRELERVNACIGAAGAA